MGATSDAATGHRFRSQILRLRGRAGLIQRALAALLSISEQAFQKWEPGQGYRSAARLQTLIALYVQHGVFAPGREVEKEQPFIAVAGDVIIDRHLALVGGEGRNDAHRGDPAGSHGGTCASGRPATSQASRSGRRSAARED